MRFKYEVAIKEYERVEKYLKENGYICEVTGSLRRKKKDVGDIDIVVTKKEVLDLKKLEKEVLETTSKYMKVESRINNYEFMLKDGISLHIIPEIISEFKYTLWQSTGPKPHVKHVKQMYKDKNKVLNKKHIEEKEVYINIGLEYIKPEERYKEINTK